MKPRSSAATVFIPDTNFALQWVTPYNQNKSFNRDLFSATNTFSSTILTVNSECVGVAKKVRIERVILITRL